ncbi:hypothetical protein AAFN86_25130 [Roseomonas sp. CAU 1739]
MRALLPLALLFGTSDLVAGGEPMPRVTTDSREYCVELVHRLVVLPGAQDEVVRRMAEDGMRLCDTGHPRTGVAKLRRAIRAAQAQP